MRQVQFPPKPNELESTYSTCTSDRKVISGTIPVSIMGVEKFKFGSITCDWMDCTQYTASMAPAAANVCPVKPLVELKGGRLSLNTLFMAIDSDKSLFPVPVPC